LPIRGGYLAGWFDAKDRWPAEIERRAGSLPMVAESGRGPTEIIPTVPFWGQIARLSREHRLPKRRRYAWLLLSIVLASRPSHRRGRQDNGGGDQGGPISERPR